MRTITATDLPRFMACQGSRLMEGFVSSVKDDTVRNEGNAAHWLIQQLHGGRAVEELTDRKAFNGVYVTPEMVENVTPYLEGIGRGGRIEYETSFRDPQGRWEVRSRADHVAYFNRVLKVDDFKYGWSLVEPHGNWTLIAHALGFVINNPTLPVDQIILTIYQPRPHHSDGRVRSWTIDAAHLRKLYDELNAKLSNPSDLLMTGPQCKDCPAAVNCPALRKAVYNAIDAAEMAHNDGLDNAALGYVMDTINRALKILEQSKKAYDELAAHRITKGEIIDGFALENELSNRDWKEFVTPEMIAVLTGRQDLTKKKLITPKQMETAGVSEVVVNSLCERRNKGVKLVRMDANKKAEKLFNKKEG